MTDDGPTRDVSRCGAAQSELEPWKPQKAAEICQPAAVPRVVESDDPALVYDPRVRKRHEGRFEILGKTENASVIAWGFWGGVLLAGLAAMVIFFGGATGLHTPMDVLLFSLVVIVGLLMFRLGRHSSLDEGLLCEIDMSRRIISWPTNFSGSEIALSFDEIDALVYGMTQFPVSKAPNASKVHAFTLRVRDQHGRLVPIIEASTHKDATHQVGNLLEKVLRIPLTYVGLGMDDGPV